MNPTVNLNYFGYAIMLGWYPALWAVWFIVSMFAFEEEALPHDEPSQRAVFSESLSDFLIGDKISAVYVSALYLLSIVLVLIVPIAVVVAVMSLICILTLTLVTILSDV